MRLWQWKMVSGPENAAGRPGRLGPGRRKWPAWLLGVAMVLATGMGLPLVDDAWASTGDIRAAGAEEAAVHPDTGSPARPADAAFAPEAADNLPAPDRQEATTDRKRPAAEPQTGELDTFSPSETIEADQGVDFPYDI